MAEDPSLLMMGDGAKNETTGTRTVHGRRRLEGAQVVVRSHDCPALQFNGKNDLADFCLPFRPVEPAKLRIYGAENRRAQPLTAACQTSNLIVAILRHQL